MAFGAMFFLLLKILFMGPLNPRNADQGREFIFGFLLLVEEWMYLTITANELREGTLVSCENCHKKSIEVLAIGFSFRFL